MNNCVVSRFLFLFFFLPWYIDDEIDTLPRVFIFTDPSARAGYNSEAVGVFCIPSRLDLGLDRNAQNYKFTNIIIIIIITTFRVFLRNSFQVPGTLLRNLADLKNLVDSTVSTHPLISKSSSPFTNPLVTIFTNPSARAGYDTRSIF